MIKKMMFSQVNHVSRCGLNISLAIKTQFAVYGGNWQTNRLGKLEELFGPLRG
jgi:hypothetical protein